MTDSGALASWVTRQRWFAGKTGRIREVAVEDEIPIGPATLAILDIGLDDGTAHRYAVPLTRGAGIEDAVDDPGYARALVELIRDGAAAPGDRGTVVGIPTRAFPARDLRALDVRRVTGEQSNTSVVLGDAMMMKHFRRLAEGANPEEEIGRFLTEHTSFAHVPRLYGHAEYRRAGRDGTALAVATELVSGAEDGWRWMLGALGAMYERVRGAPDPGMLASIGAPTLDALHRLGVRTAELHLALASAHAEPAFVPEPISAADTAAWVAAIERQLGEAARAGGERARVRVAPNLGDALAGLDGRVKIRHHGDYHLGQTLYRVAERDWVILDFEGEPLRPLAERRRKHTPLRDVAGMLRSVDYAAVSAMPPGLDAWADAWTRAAGETFVSAYRERAGAAPFLPRSDAGFTRAVAALTVEKAAYEVVYEASHRPDWLPIPLRGLERAAAALTPAASAGAV